MKNLSVITRMFSGIWRPISGRKEVYWPFLLTLVQTYLRHFPNWKRYIQQWNLSQ